MISDNDVRDFIQHYTDQIYDPVKAHEYYERTKQLTGRKSGQATSSSGRKSSSNSSSSRKTIAPESAAQKKAKFEAEVASLKSRLENLRALLRELVVEAKKRSGVDVTPEGETEPETSKTDDKLTPQQKAEKAKKSHEYYEETKGTLPSQEETHVLRQKIVLIEKKIAEMRVKLDAALHVASMKDRPSPSGPEQQTQRKGDSQNGS